jgi:hypothetical protein
MIVDERQPIGAAHRMIGRVRIPMMVTGGSDLS